MAHAPTLGQESAPVGSLPIANARSYHQTSDVVWRTAQDVVSDWGLTSSTHDNASQVLISEWKPFGDFDESPFFQSLPPLVMGDATLVPLEFQLHLFVSPFVEPARVHVGSIIKTQDGQTEYMHHSVGIVGAEFFRDLERRLGDTGEGIPAGARHETAPCPAESVTSTRIEDLNLEDVQRLADFEVFLPLLRSGVLVILDATIGFDGSVTAPRVISVNSSELDNTDVFGRVAQNLVSLWRYRPAQQASCPVSVGATVALGFGVDESGPWFYSQTFPHREVEPTPEAPSTVYALSASGVQSPRLLRDTKPQYTQEAVSELIEGDVWLEAVVLPDGTVGDTHITESLDMKYGLDVAAVMAAKQWRFEPGTLDGEPVPVRVPIVIEFNVR
jgi:TonB family protein